MAWDCCIEPRFRDHQDTTALCVLLCGHAQPSAPKSIFALSQCTADSAGFLTIGCLTRGFSPADSLTFKWKAPGDKDLNTFVQYPAFGSDGDYTKISHMRVKKSDWSPQTPYICEASNSIGSVKATLTPPGSVKPTEDKASPDSVKPTEDKASPGSVKPTEDKASPDSVKPTEDKASPDSVKPTEDKASPDSVKPTEDKASPAKFTLTLKPPIERDLFVHNKVVLEAVVSGDVQKMVQDASVSCTVNKKNVPVIRPGTVFIETSQFMRIYNVTIDKDTWFNGKSVTCTIRDTNKNIDIKQEIYFDKGDGQKPNVAIYRPDLVNKDSVSLLCEVTSRKLGNVYIMWKVDEELYTEGITSAPIYKTKTPDSKYVFSILTMSKEKYKNPKTIITCAVKHANMVDTESPLQVSTSERKPPEPEKGFALNCNKDVLEEDEFRSLWSTATSFIFLFLFSLTYSAVLSLLKMKH